MKIDLNQQAIDEADQKNKALEQIIEAKNA